MTTALDEQLVTPGEIRAELTRVLASPHFLASHQLTSFLSFIVDESLAGRSHRLKERTVACGALGRDARFDPRLDCVVRVVAGKLRRSLEHFYALDGASHDLSIQVPSGGYCPVFLRRVAAAVVGPPPGTEPLKPPIADLATRSMPGAAVARPRAKLAVLPLRLITTGSKERFLAEILSDDVAVRLGRLAALEVIDGRATRLPRSLRDNPCACAARFEADFVMAGTVGRVGEVVRFTARLLEGRSGALAWGDQFDRVVDKRPLAQQDDLADLVAAGIGRFFGVT